MSLHLLLHIYTCIRGATCTLNLHLTCTCTCTLNLHCISGSDSALALATSSQYIAVKKIKKFRKSLPFLQTLCTGCPPKKVTFRMPQFTSSITSTRHPSQPDLNVPVSGNYIFDRFLLTQSRIKRSQVISMEKFGPAAPNFG